MKPVRHASCFKTAFWTCAALLLVTALPGCSGCRDPLVKRKTKLDTLEDKKKLERKENFEIDLPLVVPGEETSAGRPMAKPGHWITVTHGIKANNFDFQAELHTAATNAQGTVYAVENTDFRLSSSRPAPLPKGQRKVFETTYFIPRAAAKETETVWLSRELLAARGGRRVGTPSRQPLMALPGYSYYFLVLASDPDTYGYLKRLTSVASPTASELSETLFYYRVLLPQVDQVAPVPSNSLTWTSTAYLLWDDFSPTQFTSDQQEALLDWLHWGGQLIISGPNSLEKLKGSFLEPFLPASAIATVEIDQAAIDEINAYWALSDAKTKQRYTLDVFPGRPLIGVSLSKHAESQDLANTAGLVTERRIGQGRIVVTSFSLTDRLLLTWRSFDSFFNACLLRRPRRQFRKADFVADAIWADYHPSLAKDSRFVTALRYFSRDLGHFVVKSGVSNPAVEPEDVPDAAEFAQLGARSDRRVPLPMEARDPPKPDWHLDGSPVRQKYGTASWNDQSGVADAARESLKDAAGISIPKGEFVLRVLALYLFVLAPLNWGFFRLLGRVEWAWVAAPVIAIVGAVSVVRFAQLDIGFARSVTEVAVAEMHAPYPRAHVTRYTALYTSLSTPYDFTFEDSSAVAQPFSAQTDYHRSPHDTVYDVNLRRRQQLQLTGYRIQSNKTGIVHSEQMCDLGGAFQLQGNRQEGFVIQNDTDFSLRDAGILRRLDDGSVEAAWIGDLTSKSGQPLEFRHLASTIPHFEQWDNSLTTLSYDVQLRGILRQLDTDDNGVVDRSESAADPALAPVFDRFDIGGRRGFLERAELKRWSRVSRAGAVSLGQLVELASQRLKLRAGDVRLLGWTDAEMPDLAISPESAQAVHRTMFLVHLQRGALPAPQPDKNRKADVVDIDDLEAPDTEDAPAELDDAEPDQAADQEADQAGEPMR